MDQKLSQYVVDSFSTENSVRKYTNDVAAGLWISEKILIEQYFTKGSTVLDLGCGPGRTTFELRQLGYQVIGVDLTPKFIEIAQAIAAQKGNGVIFEIGDATRLKYQDQSFANVLFSFNGWSMIPSKQGREEAAHEVFRILKPGGHYIFCVHKRTFFGQELTWLTQLVRLYLLKPLGYKTKELDFGDFYFRKDSETSYPIEQFVSFMDVAQVKELHQKIGFSVELMKMRSEITSEDSKLKSGDVMFFVCRKP